MAATGPTVLGSARSKITDELDAVLLVAAEQSAASEAAVGGAAELGGPRVMWRVRRAAARIPNMCARASRHTRPHVPVAPRHRVRRSGEPALAHIYRRLQGEIGMSLPASPQNAPDMSSCSNALEALAPPSGASPRLGLWITTCSKAPDLSAYLRVLQ